MAQLASTTVYGDLVVTNRILGSLNIGADSSADEIIRVRSQSFAGLELHGDTANLSGEPGGAYVFLSQDGASSNPVTSIIGLVNIAGHDGSGNSYSGTTDNSFLLGHHREYNLHLGTARTVRMTITGSGNVGIGTTSPSANLHVAGTAIITGNTTMQGDLLIDKANSWLTLKSPTSGSNGVEQAAGISIGEAGYKGSAALHITYTGDGYGHIGMGTVNASTSLPAQEAIRLYYQNNNVQFLGNVGIGTASPSSKLHVAGDVQWSGRLIAGDVPADRLTGTIDPNRLPPVARQGNHQNGYVFTVGGNANSYYPVRIPTGYAAYGYNLYSITRHYSWPAPDTWNTPTHRGGLTLTFFWTGDSGWGGNHKTIRVVEFNETYTTMVAGLELATDGVIVWLRGGNAQYELQSPAGPHATVHIHLSGHTDGRGTNFPVRSDTSRVAAEIEARWPVRGTSVAAERLSGTIPAARLPTSVVQTTGNQSITSGTKTISGTASIRFNTNQGGGLVLPVGANRWAT